MQSPTQNQRSTSLRSVIERAAGMHTAPVAGTRTMVFGACDAGAHGRCHERAVIGATVYICSCDHHNGIDAAEWDAAYGTAWWGE